MKSERNGAAGVRSDVRAGGRLTHDHGTWPAARRALKTQGIEARAVPVERLGDLRAWLQETALTGQLPESVLDHFHFDLDEACLPVLPSGRPIQSLIVVAGRSPFTGAVFHYDSRRLEFATPPTYGGSDVGDKSLPYLAAAVGDGCAFTPVRLPGKTLAVFTGLARWGRNNITYVTGWGSYVRLACLASDMPVGDQGRNDGWGPAVLPRCETCIACARACPTGAIDGDRLLLHTERCVTLMNEGDDPFPEWLESSAHSCPVGCLFCQRACPENQGCEQQGAVSEFSEAETRRLLAGVRDDELDDDLRERLRACGLLHHLAQLPRNLGVLLGVGRERIEGGFPAAGGSIAAAQAADGDKETAVEHDRSRSERRVAAATSPSISASTSTSVSASTPSSVSTSPAIPAPRASRTSPAVMKSPAVLTLLAALVCALAIFVPPAAAVQYHLYFGDLHDHTADSDGSGTAAQAYSAAKSAGADFLAVTDHTDGDYPLATAAWQAQRDAAAAATTAGFAALNGYEITMPWGHMNVYDPAVMPTVDEQWVMETGTPLSLYDWLVAHPGGIAQWNHPIHKSDEFGGFAGISTERRGVVGALEIVNDGFLFESSYTKALDGGWAVMPTANSDTHRADWISGGRQRTVLLAEGLTPSALLGALQARRGYATVVSDLRVSFRGNGEIMGSTLPAPQTISFSVRVTDPKPRRGAQRLLWVALVADGGKVVAKKKCKGYSVDWRPRVKVGAAVPGGAHYLFLRVTNASGRAAWTAPIWTGLP